MKLVLASESPRRRELLALLVRDFSCLPSDVDESEFPSEKPVDYVARLARSKARACATPDAVVIAADTTVAISDRVLGKPVDREHARVMLKLLSNRAHEVHTGLAIRLGDRVECEVVSTQVRFVELSSELIDQYLATVEPWDKAGAYGIQGMAGSFVQALNGSYSAVVGLPLLQTRLMLQRFGVPVDWAKG